ncbi:FecR family protein [Sinomicrobium soli]|uniref:FecR family protein n=1 Tax=Sinomicrobium sp. N-1-3-6 TaxID=2219864 RepID=UPI0011BDED6B|nr:FecR domain-containing protein [Sinomicrobium sp. N-1-3-6]
MDIEDIIIKRLNTALSPEEEKEFKTWLDGPPENAALYRKLEQIRLQGQDLERIRELDVDSIWEDLVKRSKQGRAPWRRKRHPVFMWSAAAALVGVCMALTVLYRPFSNREADVPGNTVKITLDKGKLELMTKGEAKHLKNKEGTIVAVQHGDTLDYGQHAAAGREASMSTIEVPYGQTFTLKLADGTYVTLNSGSSMTYPDSFGKGETRSVVLRGEAYFKVARDEQHPFVISAEGVGVEVLGTSFNLSSYTGDREVAVVLTEGSVKMYDEENAGPGREVILKPGQRGAFNRERKALSVEEADVREHTAWLEGRLVLTNTAFPEIIRKLQRTYNVEIINRYPELEDEVFTASFDVESIEEILAIFAEDTPFKFEKKNGKIMITAP